MRKSNYNNKIIETKKGKLEFTKLILVAVMILYIMVVCVGIIIVFHDYSQYGTLALVVGTPTTTAIGFYAWKAKAENMVKIKKENPEETKDISVDLNNIRGSD